MGIATILPRGHTTARTTALALASASLIGCTGGQHSTPAAGWRPPQPTAAAGGVTLLVITSLSAPGFASTTPERLALVTGAWDCWSWDVALLDAPGAVVETHLLITRSRVPAARSAIGRLPRTSLVQAEPIGFAVAPRASSEWTPIDRGPC